MYGIGSPFSVTGGRSVYSLFHGVMSVNVDFAVETFGAKFPVCIGIHVDVWRRFRGHDVVKRL